MQIKLKVPAAILLAAAAGFAYYYFFSNSKTPRANGPSVVLLSIDTLRADAVSGFGAQERQTPNLLKLASDGVSFEQAIAAAHVTAPSHATMFTGFSPFVHGVAIATPKVWKIPAKIPTIAEILRKAGYYTAAFADGGQMTAGAGFDRGFDIYKSEASGIPAKLPEIENFTKSCGSNPFFLFVHTYRAHQPYRPVGRDLDKLLKGYDGAFAKGARLAANLTPREAMTPSARQNTLLTLLNGSNAKTPEDKQFLRKLYDSGVSGADDEAGELLQLLKKLNIYENALVIVTSDHGEAFFEHGMDGHKNVFDECTRVPLMMKFPGGARAGSKFKATFPAVDLTPTILDILKIPFAAESFEGTALGGDLLTKEMQESTAYSAWLVNPADRFPRGVAARRAGGKRIEVRVQGDMPSWLSAFTKNMYFSFSNDAAEKVNKAGTGDPLDSTLETDMNKIWERWRDWRDKLSSDTGAAGDLSRETIDGLNAIGYVK